MKVNVSDTFFFTETTVTCNYLEMWAKGKKEEEGAEFLNNMFVVSVLLLVRL